MPGAKSKTRMSTKKTRSAEIKKESVFNSKGSADCAPFTVIFLIRLLPSAAFRYLSAARATLSVVEKFLVAFAVLKTSRNSRQSSGRNLRSLYDLGVGKSALE